MQRDGQERGDPRSVLWAAVPLGIGLVGAIDEIIFHQLLQWHNFYVDTSERWRVFSDGLLHVFLTSMLFFGAWRLWQERRSFSATAGSRPFWAGVLLGGGGFHLWDGVVDHKLLRLHPVREGADNMLVYDVAWIAAALLLLALGWALWRGVQAPERAAGATSVGGPRTRSKA